LQQAAALLRLEIQTLEMHASRTQANLIQEAKDKAEAIVHAAELEASAIALELEGKSREAQKQAEISLLKIEHKVASSETYLQNLRSVFV